MKKVSIINFLNKKMKAKRSRVRFNNIIGTEFIGICQAKDLFIRTDSPLLLTDSCKRYVERVIKLLVNGQVTWMKDDFSFQVVMNSKKESEGSKMKEIKEYWDEAKQKLKTHYFLKDGKRHGLFQRWYDNGQKEVEFNYINDKRHGLFQCWYKNGQKEVESNWVNGKRHGLYQDWYKNGQKWEESWYINGVKYKSKEEYEKSETANMEEIKEYWDEAKQKLKTHYFLKDGKRHGLFQCWYKNGQKEVESNWVNGKLHGLHQYWHENGKKWVEFNYVNGEFHGLYQSWDKKDKRIESWYINGVKYKSKEEYEKSETANMEEIKRYWDKTKKVLRAHYFLKDGKLHGLYRDWHENGQKWEESNWVNGELHGLCRRWYENGQKSEESNYVNGKRHDKPLTWNFC